jgi:hypothetical protein
VDGYSVEHAWISNTGYWMGSLEDGSRLGKPLEAKAQPKRRVQRIKKGCRPTTKGKPKKLERIRPKKVTSKHRKKRLPTSDLTAEEYGLSSSGMWFSKWEMVDGVKVKWNPINLPSQSDVLVSSLISRMCFDQHGLLAEALGMGKKVSARSGVISFIQENGLLVPRVPCPDGSCYFPPHPTSCWKFAGFRVSKDGRVACEVTKEATRTLWQYTMIHFLQQRHRSGFIAYLNKALRPPHYEYRPYRLKTRGEQRIRDPLKMIVFYVNKRAFPMAVCLLLRDKQGAFALVDDFGKVMAQTMFMFLVNGPIERSICPPDDNNPYVGLV